MRLGKSGATLIVFWLCTVSHPAAASTSIIDDSASRAIEPSVAMHWRTPIPTRGAPDNVQIGTLRVLVRLDVAQWLHRHGRIYLSLPAQPPGPIDLSWTAEGRLSSGRLHSGERRLVYAGPITQPFIEEPFTFQFELSGALLDRPVQVSYHFEMEED